MSIKATFLIFSLFLLISWHRPLHPQFSLKTIVLDAGHGGKDPGCIGRSIREKEVNLDIALRLGKLIKEGMPDVKIVYTRKDDKFIELHDRAGLANKNGADLFISIHSNSGPQGMSGTETYCMGLDKTGKNLEVAKRENSSILLEKGHKEKYDNFDPSKPESYILFSLFQNAYLSNSLRLAEKIEKEFRLTANRTSRGVKQAGFLVLWKTSMPSVLVESGFLTDKNEDTFLSTPDGRQAIAQSIYCALESYADDLN